MNSMELPRLPTPSQLQGGQEAGSSELSQTAWTASLSSESVCQSLALCRGCYGPLVLHFCCPACLPQQASGIRYQSGWLHMHAQQHQSPLHGAPMAGWTRTQDFTVCSHDSLPAAGL